MSKDTLDLRQDTQYDLVINKDRTLAAVISAVTMSGGTEVDFDFTSYTGATLDVRQSPKSDVIILGFTTDDNSIILSTTGNTFQLNKTFTELANIKTGTYEYDMYLQSVEYPKRAFLNGNFIIEDRITR